AAVAGGAASLRAARSRFQQSRRRGDQAEEGTGRPSPGRHPVPSVLHGEGSVRRGNLPDPVRLHHFLRADRRWLVPGARQFHSANNLVTPAEIKPVWYFTPFYA